MTPVLPVPTARLRENPNPSGRGDRIYRSVGADPRRWVSFQAAVETTDLYVLARANFSSDTLAAARRARSVVEDEIRRRPVFATSLEPIAPPDRPSTAPVAAMYAAARIAGVGPMAAVAGALAAVVGQELRTRSEEVIVENGGDIYLSLREEGVVGLFAGSSPFSGQLGLRIRPSRTPLGVCTSSGTVGPSLSFGCADAATVLAPDAALADAVATALGNRVQGPEDLEQAVSWALSIPGVTGAVAILGDRLAAQGDVEFVKTSPQWSLP